MEAFTRKFNASLCRVSYVHAYYVYMYIKWRKMEAFTGKFNAPLCRISYAHTYYIYVYKMEEDGGLQEKVQCAIM